MFWVIVLRRLFLLLLPSVGLAQENWWGFLRGYFFIRKVSWIPVTGSFELLVTRCEQDLVLHLPLSFQVSSKLPLLWFLQDNLIFKKTAMWSVFSRKKYTVKTFLNVLIYWEKLYSEIKCWLVWQWWFLFNNFFLQLSVYWIYRAFLLSSGFSV